MAAVNCATPKARTKSSFSANSSVRRRGCSSWHVKTSSTLLQSALRADFALPFPETDV
jgi:hypothetical protein